MILEESDAHKIVYAAGKLIDCGYVVKDIGTRQRDPMSGFVYRVTLEKEE
ncbi:hypothetical protein G7084_00175 [Weissella coleopterorum]|uniref:Uncharacterized protein n=1 Tax=Weissella coleopterorum TaxID=2714949 RepID=A0A6G8AXZ8_9LACO|nr:hypothetical protein [Weissella coleopterorum]QIL49876.1 hypothetical protein G7084_00175 [Weissella coleopterorum]